VPPREPMFEGPCPTSNDQWQCEGVWRPEHRSFWRPPASLPHSTPFRSTGLKVGLLNPALPIGFGAKPQPPTILLHFEGLDRNTTDDIENVHCSMHMTCPSVPISASTELTEFFSYFVSCLLGPPRSAGRVCRGGSYAPGKDSNTCRMISRHNCCSMQLR